MCSCPWLLSISVWLFPGHGSGFQTCFCAPKSLIWLDRRDSRTLDTDGTPGKANPSEKHFLDRRLNLFFPVHSGVHSGVPVLVAT
jgi:hypothetical protein